MKQKLVRMVIILCSVWTLTGCQRGNAGQGTAENEGVEETGMQEGENPREEDNQEENGGQTETENTAQAAEGDADYAEAPFVRMHTIYYEEEDSYEYATGSLERAEIVGDAFPKLAESIGSLFDEAEEEFRTTMRSFVEDCKQQREDMGENTITYYLGESTTVYRLDGAVASFLLAEESYAGGVHGNYYMHGITYDSATGEKLTLADLGDIGDDVLEAIDKMVAEKREEGEFCSAYEDIRDDLLDELEWYLDNKGLQIVLNTYTIASYAEGAFFVTLPYDEMPDFSDAYKPKDGPVSYRLDYTGNKGDFDGDGREDVLEIKTEMDEYDNEKFFLSYNGEVTELGYCAFFGGAYYLSGADGRNYVIVSYDEASDDYVTCLYEIKDGRIEELPAYVGGNLQNLVGNRIGLETYVYTLGTYAAYRSYRIEDGAFVPVEERFEFYNGETITPERGIVLKEALKVMLERDGEMTEEELPAGTPLYPVNSDEESVLGFRLDDGTYGELSFVREDGMIYMDGMSEYEVFEDLPYAG